MCFGAEFLFYLIAKVIFVVFLIMILRIWVLPWMGAPRPDGTAPDARWIATVNAIIWVIGALFVLYICWIVFECVFSGPGIGGGPYLRHGQ
jgi:hypothetical protein